MREKNKIKLVLSLLIALAFVLPTASVMGVGNSSTELVKASTPTKNIINVGTAESSQAIFSTGETEMAPMDDDGCYPVDVTALSVDGVTIEDDMIFRTGTYPIDMTVCKTEWDPDCMNVWSTITVDAVQEMVSPTAPRYLTPLYVYAMCTPDTIIFNFTVPIGQGGYAEPIGAVALNLYGDLGAVTYVTRLTDPDPTKMYLGATPIPGSVVTRTGGWPSNPAAPAKVVIEIPRDGVWWATCCQSITWTYFVFAEYDEDNNYQVGGPFEDPCRGDFYPATVKKFVEIYKKTVYPENRTENKTVDIYCEDFEDPCEIVENWETLDQPVWGANGALDTWTWSDKRYCSAGHSMHSTSFDTYLPDQIDILRLNFGGNGLNVTEYCQICVTWCQWIEGDFMNIGNETNPVILIQDYGYFQYSSNGIDWVPVAAEKYYNSDGQTETISVCIDTSNMDTLFMQWVWKSDPKFCYEGWYIDDVCINGTICGEIITPERTVWEFYYDSHSWPQTFDDECEYYVFPEEWIATEGEYRICGWLEALDDCHYSSTPYDDMFCVYIRVGDILDLAVDCDNVFLDPPSPVVNTTNVTITAEICNIGTLDATNVQVNAKVGRGFYFGGYETSFEGMTNEPNGIMKRWENFPGGNAFIDEWVTNWNALGRSFWHYTTYEHSDGGTAIANWDYNESHPQPWSTSTVSGSDYIRGPDIFVLGHIGANIVVQYDAKMNYGTGEELRPGLWDWDLGSGYFYNAEKGPYYADWATYEYELTPLFESLLGAGAAPTDAFCLGAVFYRVGINEGDPACPWQSKWRGVVIDNFVVPPQIPDGEVVLDETQIIPWLNATLDQHNCTTLKWYWNDTVVGDYYYCVEIITQDDNLKNQKCCNQYQVYNFYECPDFYCEDYTGQGPGHWLVDGCCGGVLWDGVMSTTMYGNDWDDSLFLKNATGGINFNVTGLPICVEFDTWFQMQANDFGIFEYSTDGGMHWTPYYYYGNSTLTPPFDASADIYGWLIDEQICFTGTNETQMRFRFTSNLTGTDRGFLVDNIEVINDTTDFVIFSSDGTDISKFYAHETQTGCWWQEPWIYEWFVWDIFGDNLGGVEPDVRGWGPDYYEPSYGVYDPDPWTFYETGLWGYQGAYPDNHNAALVWDIDTPGLWKSWFTTTTYYDTETSTEDAYWNTSSPLFDPNAFNDTGFIEAKADTDADWTILSEESGSYLFDNYGPYPVWWQVSQGDWYTYTAGHYIDLSAFMEDTEKASVRFRFLSDQANRNGFAGFGMLWMSCMYGMRDVTAPISQASMTGTFDQECHWYTSPVTITVTATDDLTGVCTIYYELDGVVHEYIMPVVVNTDGLHTFCYWAVDCEGNVEAKKCLPEFRIDLTGPTVSITGPATGYLYLFGNQLFALKSGKTIFLFNGIPVTATATATDASIATVQFFLDDVLMTEDTTAPYSARLSTKHSGPATIKVTAIDILGHSASDTMNIDNYLKLF